MENYSEYTDIELYILLKQGDHTAFTEIYNRYWAVLFRHARRMLYDDDDAGDIIQDVFTNLYTNAAQNELTSLRGYLYAAVRNRVLDKIRRNKLTETYLHSLGEYLEKGVTSTEDQVSYNELSALIDREIAQLPKKMREAFELSRKLNLSYKEIAIEMNTSDETVKKQISRALKRLRLKFNSITRLLFF
jgi:RNA polymerase sigma-70 factor (family 1)